jgi:serine/threonine protein kinase
VDLQPEGALVGQTLPGGVELERLLFADSVGERYMGTQGEEKVRVLVFNQRFTPELERADLIKATHALIGSPTPDSIGALLRWELGESPAFMVERVEPGAPLRTLIAERGGLDWPLALRLTCNLARALEWMEQLGVVHRALHPGALIVTDIQAGKLQVAEWGLGVLTHHPDPMSQAQAGELVPYAEYMPPEKISERGRSDRKSLVYQMGLLLYEMIAGKPAFGGASDLDLLKQHLHERPAKLTALRGDANMPAALEDLLEMMLDRSPDKRFQMPGAAVNALSSLLTDATPADFPVLARPEAAKAEPAKAAPKKPEGEREDTKKTMMMGSIPALKPPTPEPAKAEPVKAVAVSGGSQVEDASKPTEQMDMGVLGSDRKADKKPGDVEIFDPEASKGDKPSTIILSKDFSEQPAAPEPEAPSSTIVISKDFSDEATKKSTTGGISGSGATEPVKVEEPKKKKKTGKQKALSQPVEDNATKPVDTVAAAKQAEEAAIAKKKADDEAAAKKAADDKVAAAKKTADDELAAAKKKGEEEIAAAKKKADDEAAAAKKKADDEVAANKKKAEDATKQRVADAQKKAEQAQPDLKQPSSSSSTPRKTMGMRALGATDGEADAWFLDSEQAEMAIEQAEVKEIEEHSARRTKTILIALFVGLILFAIIFIIAINTLDFGKPEEEGALPQPPSSTRLG